MLEAIFWFVEVVCFSTLFPNLEECKLDSNNFFSRCIFLTACQCLHESARFMTFKIYTSQVCSQDICFTSMAKYCKRPNHFLKKLSLDISIRTSMLLTAVLKILHKFVHKIFALLALRNKKNAQITFLIKKIIFNFRHCHSNLNAIYCNGFCNNIFTH